MASASCPRGPQSLAARTIQKSPSSKQDFRANRRNIFCVERAPLPVLTASPPTTSGGGRPLHPSHYTRRRPLACLAEFLLLQSKTLLSSPRESAQLDRTYPWTRRPSKVRDPQRVHPRSKPEASWAHQEQSQVAWLPRLHYGSGRLA